MDADWSVEIGGDAPALEYPWRSPDPNGPRYLDLKAHPELIDCVEEAVRYPELREFLLSVNSPSSLLQTAKCDVWSTSELSAEEEIYGGACKFGCYVDLLFSSRDIGARLSFARHEHLARALADLLKAAPEIPAKVEFIVRRCYYGTGNVSDAHIGFYVTLYVFGYGREEASARAYWAEALQQVQAMLLA